MKHLKKHWSAQPLSLLLSVLMALPVLALFLLRAPAAQAQNLAAQQPTWGVLDFANPSGYGGADVGRLAADSFVIELAKLNRYSIRPRQDILSGIQAENLTPPLNLTSIERLGESLGVDAMVAGEIASVSFSSDHRQAKVSLVVRVIDPRTGLLLNGALAQGLSNPRPIPVNDEETLVNEAFGNAAFNAVKQISRFNLPVATVLIGRDTQAVTLNKGTRDGLYNGLDMVVTRNGVVTGRIRVSDASNNDANATITDLGTGIRPEDRATALYTLPNYTVNRQTGTFNGVATSDVQLDTPSRGTTHSVFSGIGGILVALLTGALLVSAIRAGHSDGSLGGAEVGGGGGGGGGPQAIAGRAQDLGGAQQQLFPLSAVGVNIPTYIPVVVRITADTGNINSSSFLEYHVYRSDSPPILSTAANFPGSISIGTGGNNTNNGNNNGNTGGIGFSSFGQIPLLVQTGHSRLNVFDDYQPKIAVTASKPDNANTSIFLTFTLTSAITNTGTNGGFGGTNSGTNTNGTGGVTTGFGGIIGTGLTFGERVNYAIEGLYLQPNTLGANTNSGGINPGTGSNNGQNTNTNGQNTNGGGQNTNGGGGQNTNGGGQNTNGQNTSGQNTSSSTGHQQTYQLTGLRYTNYVTYIEPVQPTGNAVTGTGLNNVNVTVPATAGANDYILQISTDPGFSNSQTFKAAPGSFNATSSNPTNAGVTLSPATGNAVVFNNINVTSAFPNGTTFFYRVGARDSSNNGQSGFSNPYIFSDPLALSVSGITAAARALGRSPSNIHRSRN